MKLNKMMGSNQRITGILSPIRSQCETSKLRWWLLIGVCIFLSHGHAAPPVAAEPSHSIQFLMREPVTMMDWGFQNIEDYLYRQRHVLMQADKRLFESEPMLAVEYDWEQNRILIAITLRMSAKVQLTSGDLAEIRAHLEWLIKYLRGSLTMKPYDAFFRHRGFRNQDSPRNLAAELAEQTDLLIRVRDAEANILSQCMGRLAGSEIYWPSIGTQ